MAKYEEGYMNTLGINALITFGAYTFFFYLALLVGKIHFYPLQF